MKKKVYFVQSGMTYERAVYLPYSAGCLAAFAWQDETVRGEYEIADFLFRHESVDACLKKIKDPAIVSFTCLNWNYEYSKALAKKVKERYPDCLIFFGGHQITNDFSALNDNPFVDVLFHAESEESFLAALRALAGGNSLDDVPNISYRATDGPRRTKNAAPGNLADYPSPYLAGLFDRYIDAGRADEFCYIMETNRGCPYRCAYCDWCFTKEIRTIPMSRVKSEVDWFASRKAEYIFCADANFGILERDLDIAKYIVEVKKRTGYPLIFNGCYAKNSNDTVFQISKLLYDNKANKAATLAYQSMNTAALENVNRKNFTVENFSKLLRQYNEAGIPTYTEMILGLPGETYDSFCRGLCDLIEAGQHTNCTVYACQVYPNALMGQQEYRDRYGIVIARMPINFIRFVPPREGEIREYIDVVVETADMSRAMMARAMTFCTCLQCFHHIGLLRCFAMYLRHEHDIAYLDFYTRLMDYVLEADTTLIRPLFKRVSAMCLDIESGEWTYQDSRFGETGWFLEEGAFMELVYDYERFWAEIEPFLSSFDIDKAVAAQLYNYQKNIIRLPGREKVVLEQQYDFYRYFFNIQAGRYSPLEKKANRLTLTADETIGNWKEYARLVMLFAKRRGDTVMTSALKNVRVEYINEGGNHANG